MTIEKWFASPKSTCTSTLPYYPSVPSNYSLPHSSHLIYIIYLFTYYAHILNLIFKLLEISRRRFLAFPTSTTSISQLHQIGIYCPCIITRTGERLRANGKFGGKGNRMPSNYKGPRFTSPPPAEIFQHEASIGQRITIILELITQTKF